MGLLSLVLFSLQCTAGNSGYTVTEPAGFLIGLWHGAISGFTLVIQVFSDSIKVYEIYNCGGWYDFGFWLGVTSIWGGGSHHGVKRARRKRNR